MHVTDDSQRTRGRNWAPQITLRGLFLWITVFVVGVTLYKFHLSPPFWLCVPYAGLVASGAMARKQLSPDLAWGVFVLSWCAVLWEINNAQRNCYGVVGAFRPHETARCLMFVYVTGMALPLILSIGLVPAIGRIFQARRSRARTCFLLTLLLAQLDVALQTSVSALLMLQLGP